MALDHLVVEIEAQENGGFRAKILRGPYGEARNTFLPPFDPVQSEQELARLETLLSRAMEAQYEFGQVPEKADDEVRQAAEEVLQAAQGELLRAQYELGRRLLGQLFQGTLAQKLNRCLGYLRGRSEDERLRVQLVFDPHEERLIHLAALPWELMCHLDTNEFLARSRKTTITRYLETDQRIEPFRVEGQLRVLLVDSSPKNLTPLRVLEEQNNIREALEGHADVDVEVCRNPSVKDLYRRLRYGDPVHILHFMGHGGFDPGTGEGTLAFTNEEGTDERATGGMVLEMLKELRHLKLVVLCTCQGAAPQRRKGQFPHLGIAPAVLRAGIPAVVAMQFPISDEAAIAFSDALFHALAHFDPVDVAVAEGRKAIRMNPEVAGEWATPTLFLRVAGGQLFEPPQDDGQAVSTKVVEPEAEPLSVGIRSGVRHHERDHVPDLEEKVDAFCDLSRYFDEDRLVKTAGGWQRQVFPDLKTFLFGTMDRSEGRTLDLNMAAHASIAFAAGYVLEAKSGFAVQIRQRTQQGKFIEWKHDEPWPQTVLWHRETPREIDPEASDVALAISVTTPVLADVEEYIELTNLPVGRILPVSIAPEPGGTSVKSGTHALALAQQLANILRERTAAERRGVLHIFGAAPNALLFFLGQQGRSFGRVQLYEHDLSSGRFGDYRPSLRLPAHIDWAQETEPDTKVPGDGRGHQRTQETKPDPKPAGEGRTYRSSESGPTQKTGTDGRKYGRKG